MTFIARSSPKRGDVVLVLFPFSDHQTVKRRPALVVQSNKVNRGGSQILVAQITSVTRRAGLPTRVEILLTDPVAAGTGLMADSVIVADNLATLDMSLVEKRLGLLSDMTLVDDALRKTFDL